METTNKQTTTVTTTEQVTTSNALYSVTAIKSEGVLTEIKAEVMVQETENIDGELFQKASNIGTLSYIKEQVKVNVTASGAILATLITEFMQIVEDIKAR